MDFAHLKIPTVFRQVRSLPKVPGAAVCALRLCWCVWLLTTAHAQSRPPNYWKMPATNFTCEDKATGGYYADPEAHCQVFHVCVRVGENEITDFKYLCPNDTVFDQQNFICTNWREIDCQASTKYYSKNDIFKEEPEKTEFEQVEESAEEGYYEYVYEYVDQEANDEAASVDYPESTHRLKISKSTSQQERPNENPKATIIFSSGHTSDLKQKFSLPTLAPLIVSTGNNPEAARTVVTSPRTTTTTTRKTTSFITTHRPAFQLPFREDFDLGDPVVTAAPKRTYVRPSTQSDRSKVDLPRVSTTIPDRVSSGSIPWDRSRSLPRSPTTQANVARSKIESHRLSVDSDDPFADFDWKRDASSVTSSAKTRYETLFGNSGSRDHLKGGKEITRRRTDPEESPGSPSPVNDSKVVYSRRNSNYRSPPKSRSRSSTPSDFSNFRYYKTAFGWSYSSDDLRPTNRRHLSSFKERMGPIASSSPVHPEPKTASRNTRYSAFL